MLRTLLAVILLLLVAVGLLQTEWAQNWVARRVTARLARDLQTRISIDHVQFAFFNKMNLRGVLLEDQRQDTLLYAGNLQVRITDWFFLKDEADLEYIGLENAQVHLNRAQDSVWNYAFLQDYFASGSSTANTHKKSAGITFHLKEVSLSNVTFIQRDGWVGTDLTVRLGALYLDADEIDFSKRRIDIDVLRLTEPYFATLNYEGQRGPRPKKPASTHWNPQDWQVTAGVLHVQNGTYRIDQDSLGATTPNFDGRHLLFSGISGTIDNFRWLQDTIRGTVALSARERSGLQVRSLRTEATIHPRAMAFDELRLQTNRSTLGDYFTLRFEDIGRMSNFIEEVTMEADFRQAIIASDDLAFFAPDVRNWNKTIRVNGRVEGTVDALTGRNLEIRAGSDTYVKGDVTLMGLPDIQQTYINLTADDLRTTYNDAAAFVPALRRVTTPDLRSLSSLRFQGSFTGFITDFVTFGTIRTPMGTVVTDLNMKLPENGQPVYNGTVSTPGFQLGNFLNSPRLGDIAFTGKIQGRGFNWQTLNATLQGTVDRLEYDGYAYQNITADGSLRNRQFDGTFVIRDPNADLRLQGLIDFSGARPTFNVVANVTRADLRALQLASEDLQVSGDFNLNIEGSSLSDLLGYARISNARLLHNGQPLSFDSLTVQAGYVNGLKTLQASSNEFTARVTGDFDLKELPEAFTLFLNRYYPSYIRVPRGVKPQSFSFDITTGNVEEYMQLIDPRLTGFNNSHVRGSLDLGANSMTIDADVPYLAFNQYSFSDVQLRGNGDLEKLVLTGQVNNAVVSDSLVFPQTNFSIVARNDVSDVSITTTANQTINQAALSAQIRTFSDGATILFNPSSFVLNGKTWTIEEDGELSLRRNTIPQGELVLRESNQRIRVYTEPSAIGDWNDLRVEVQDLNLGDLSPLLLPRNRLEGLVSGDIRIEDPQDRLNISAALTTEALRLDNDSIGQVEAIANYNNRTGTLTGSGFNLNPNEKIRFELDLDLDDSANVHRDRITVMPVNYPVKILERFIGTLFNDLRGNVTGALNILGEGADRKFVGKFSLRDAGLKVAFTQVFYRLQDTEIELKEDRIEFNDIRLRDTLGNTATLRGDIRHQGFANMVFDLVIQTDDRPMLLLNTTLNDNQTFYGRAFGTGSLVLVGPQDDMFMNITARASEVDSSHIVLPPSETRESGLANFMVERKYGREMNARDLGAGASNLNYDINLTANPRVKVEVILDELTGDIIRGWGRGNLNISSGTSLPLTIQGRYDIEEGNYLFTFQSFFKRPFELRKGGNSFIEWNGDPYDANIRFEAVYRAENVSFAPLAVNLFAGTGAGGTQPNYNSYRSDVNVLATLTGKLFEPQYSFNLELPQNVGVSQDPGISIGLQQIARNPNELINQVTYLIVFNSFAPFENISQPGFNPLQEFTTNTISGLLFGEVNRRLNQLLSGILRNNKLTFNFSGSLYNRNLVSTGGSTSGFINQSNLNFSIGGQLFQGRANFSIGSTLDVPIQGSFQQQLYFLPDVTLELLINQSGSLRATFFYRQNMDFLYGGSNAAAPTMTRYGTSLVYRKEFDSFTETVMNKKRERGKRKPVVDSTAPAAADTTAQPPMVDSSRITGNR